MDPVKGNAFSLLPATNRLLSLLELPLSSTIRAMSAACLCRLYPIMLGSKKTVYRCSCLRPSWDWRPLMIEQHPPLFVMLHLCPGLFQLVQHPDPQAMRGREGESSKGEISRGCWRTLVLMHSPKIFSATTSLRQTPTACETDIKLLAVAPFSLLSAGNSIRFVTTGSAGGFHTR